MDRKEYCDRVLAQVGRLTSDEANDLRNELAGHIEDHAEALVEHGYTEDAAYGRAVALMGDPEETGRALRAVRRLVARHRAARRAHPHGAAVRDDRGADREVERPLRRDP